MKMGDDTVWEIVPSVTFAGFKKKRIIWSEIVRNATD
jgi:hypothetical protein